MNVFDGINQTEDLKVQLKVLEIIHQIVLDYGKSHLVVESASSSPLLGSLQYNAESVDVLNVPNSFGSKLPPDSMLYKIVSLLFNVFVFHVPLLSSNPNVSSNHF